jgi:hypothetical protein
MYAAMTSPMPIMPQAQMQHQQAHQAVETGSKAREGAFQASPSGSYVPPRFLRPPEAQQQQRSQHLAHWGPGDHQAHAQGQVAFAAASSGGAVGGASSSRMPYAPTDQAPGGSAPGSGQPPFSSVSRSLDSKGGGTPGMYMASNINAAYFKTPSAPRQSNAGPSSSGQVNLTCNLLFRDP